MGHPHRVSAWACSWEPMGRRAGRQAGRNRESVVWRWEEEQTQGPDSAPPDLLLKARSGGVIHIIRSPL